VPQGTLPLTWRGDRAVTGFANAVTWLTAPPPIMFDVTVTVAPSAARICYDATSTPIGDTP